MTVPAPGGSEPGLGDQVALELRDGAQHVEQQAARGRARAGVHALVPPRASSSAASAVRRRTALPVRSCTDCDDEGQEPEDIGELVAFLASPAASFVTATAIPYDGGYLGAPMATLDG